MEAVIFNIQRFSIHDGPGIRTTAFMKGCNLRCRWCHNPESHRVAPELQFFETKCIACGACRDACPTKTAARFTDACTLCGRCADSCYAGALEITGRRIDTAGLLDEIRRDAALCRKSGGGVTFSGGEPLLQMEFLAELLPLLQAEGIHTAIETAAHVPWETLAALLPHLDLVMCDVKCIDEALHRTFTGASNARILDNIRRIAASDTPLVLRTPVIPGFNDSEAALDAIGAFIASLPREIPLELLPFHNIGRDKYASLARDYDYTKTEPPPRAQMELLAAAARRRGITVTIR